jgi:hypothetical protein
LGLRAENCTQWSALAVLESSMTGHNERAADLAANYVAAVCQAGCCSLIPELVGLNNAEDFG